MIKKQKPTRKELLKQPDGFMSTTGKIIRFGVEHQQKLWIGGIALLVLLMAIGAARYMMERSEKKAFAELNRIVSEYEASDKKGAELLDEVRGRFDAFLSRYSGKSAGRLGKLTFAGICYNGRDYDKAVELYGKALKDFSGQPFYENLIRTGLGQAHAAGDGFERAADFFETAAADNAPMPDIALFNLALTYEAAGEMGKSQASLKKLLETYPDSMYADIAGDKLEK